MGAKGSWLGGRAGSWRSACHVSGSLPNHEPNKENCYSERHNRRPMQSLVSSGEP